MISQNWKFKRIKTTFLLVLYFEKRYYLENARQPSFVIFILQFMILEYAIHSNISFFSCVLMPTSYLTVKKY